MPIARINGIDLYYEMHGEGPTVVLSHGVGSNHLHWWQQIPILSTQFRVITFDHRGFGFSTDNGRGGAAFVDDLIGLLDHLSVSRVALVGQSMGGFTVAGVASRQPERVSALVLSSTSAGLVNGRPPLQKVRDQLLGVTDYEQLVHVLIHQDGFPRRKPHLCFLCEQMAQLNRDVKIGVLSEIAQLRFESGPIKSANIPVFLIGGQEDEGAHAAMREIVELFPKSGLRIIPDTGHLLFFEYAEAWTTPIRDLLAGALLGAASA